LKHCLEGTHGFSKWDLNGGGDVFALRNPSRDDAGRVKAWRKIAREGVLPPLLLFFVSGMDSWLLLDGHDRLRAALLEGVSLSLLLLSTIRRREWPDDPDERATHRRAIEQKLRYPLTPAQLDAVNQRLIWTYREPAVVLCRTRAWPIPEGRGAWRDEVERLLGRSSELLSE
jgi:hypothetical protein